MIYDDVSCIGNTEEVVGHEASFSDPGGAEKPGTMKTRNVRFIALLKEILDDVIARVLDRELAKLDTAVLPKLKEDGCENRGVALGGAEQVKEDPVEMKTTR